MTIMLVLLALALVVSVLLEPRPPRTWKGDYDDMVDRYEVTNLRPGSHQGTMIERDRLLAERDARNFYRRTP